MDSPLVATLGQRAEPNVARRVAPRADRVERGDEIAHVVLPAARPPAKEQRQQQRMWVAHPAVAGGGHDRDQRQHALGVIDRHQLGDHPSHRDADNVRRAHAEVAEQSGGVRRHVRQRVRGCATVSQQELSARWHR